MQIKRRNQQRKLADSHFTIFFLHLPWPEIADYFYEYLGRDVAVSTILNVPEGRVHRLRKTLES
jgi:hypothetical protein